MVFNSSSIFVRWIVHRRESTYPKPASFIKFNPFLRKERNYLIIKDYIGKKEDPELIQQFKKAWNEYRVIPNVGRIEGFTQGVITSPVLSELN